jgi:dolichyl-phosphate-mannose-protein mannosyltransferase
VALAAKGESIIKEQQPRHAPADRLRCVQDGTASAGPVPQWSRADSFAIVALLLAAAVTRFANLGVPPPPIFDEHFTLGLARCYLHNLPYSDAHPPLAGQIIALSVVVFGDRPWSWRLASATLGTALVGVSYLAARRMFGSRLASVAAGLLVLCDGMFLVESRLALWEIFYLTFAACSYLFLFRAVQLDDHGSRRRTLALLGLTLGLAMASKLLIPFVTLVLVVSWLVFFMIREAYPASGVRLRRQVAGSVLLIGGLSGLVYTAVYLPNYWWGWWNGVADQVTYYKGVVRSQRALGFAVNPHPYASEWFTWPLLLRPMELWKEADPLAIPDAGVASIRALGNPIIWWAALVAILLAAINSVRRKSMALAFLASGYVLYLGMWIPIARYKFIYYYLPALYLGILALADVLDECWWGNAESWEQVALLLALLPSLVLGLGVGLGLTGAVAIAVSFSVLLRKGKRHSGRFVCIWYMAAVLVAFVYFFPLWTGEPITPAEFHARMWLAGWM